MGARAWAGGALADRRAMATISGTRGWPECCFEGKLLVGGASPPEYFRSSDEKCAFSEITEKEANIDGSSKTIKNRLPEASHKKQCCISYFCNRKVVHSGWVAASLMNAGLE